MFAVTWIVTLILLLVVFLNPAGPVTFTVRLNPPKVGGAVTLTLTLPLGLLEVALAVLSDAALLFTAKVTVAPVKFIALLTFVILK